jgi:hypothetical protein
VEYWRVGPFCLDFTRSGLNSLRARFVGRSSRVEGAEIEVEVGLLLLVDGLAADSAPSSSGTARLRGFDDPAVIFRLRPENIRLVLQ